MANETVFIVSRDPAVRDSLSELVASAGLHAETKSSLEAWLQVARSEPHGCLVLDVCPGSLDDSEQLASFTRTCARIPVLVLTERGDVPTAVRAIKLGAADVLQKPCLRANFLVRIKHAVAAR